jgi:hypothetical protein
MNAKVKEDNVPKRDISTVEKISPSPRSVESEEKIENDYKELEEDQNMEYNDSKSVCSDLAQAGENQESCDVDHDNVIESSSQESSSSIKNEPCKVRT